MGDHDRRGAVGPQGGDHVGADLGPQGGVEGGERLVEQHQRGVGRQRPGEGHPLLLPAGELVGAAPLEPVEADEGEALGDPVGTARAPSEPEPDVPGHVEVGEQGALLGHDPDPAPLGGDEGARRRPRGRRRR